VTSAPRTGILAALLMVVAGLAATPAQAALGDDQRTFERFLHRVPRSRWKTVPDSAAPGFLYAGRVGSIATIVRIILDGHQRIVGQKVEVALPTDVNDDLGLAVLTRFMSEFVHHPQELQPVMATMRAMRRTIMASGHRATHMPYRDVTLTLSLDSSEADFNPRTVEVPWGVLYWKVDARRARPGD